MEVPGTVLILGGRGGNRFPGAQTPSVDPLAVDWFVSGVLWLMAHKFRGKENVQPIPLC